jgi:Ni/Co efflux regulator RcnB
MRMKSLSTVSLVLALGLAGTALHARDDRPGRGADYGESNSSRQESNRGRGDDAVRGDVGNRTSGARDGGGRGDYGRGEGGGGRGDYGRGEGGGGRGGYERGGDFRHSEGSGGDRDLNTRIAGWQGGHREPERNGGSQTRMRIAATARTGAMTAAAALAAARTDTGATTTIAPRDDTTTTTAATLDGRVATATTTRVTAVRDWRHPDWRRHWSHGWSGDRYRAPARYVYPRGYRSHSWRIGYVLPPVFIVSNWYVDWRHYRLAAPPWGCRWLRVDGDLLLIDERSGEIVDALYGFFYY